MTKITNLWKKVKDWSGWSLAGTVFKARVEQITGLILAGMASLMAFDFMPYLNQAVDWFHVAIVAGYMFATGVVGEIVRKANTQVVDGHLVPDNVVVDVKKTKALNEG